MATDVTAKDIQSADARTLVDILVNRAENGRLSEAECLVAAGRLYDAAKVARKLRQAAVSGGKRGHPVF
jgi:hypothetical protein